MKENGKPEIPELPKEKKLAETKPTATERALKAKQEMESLFQAAIDEQLEIIREAEARLQELGHEQSSGPAKSKRAQRSSDPDKPCSVCKFVTVPTHDGRLKAHRDQGEKKKPLTDKELADSGLKRR